MAQVVAADSVSVVLSVLPPSVRSRTHLYAQWVSIARAHAIEAHEALAQASRVGLQGDRFGQLLNREFEAALVSVCASAFAIDALHGVLLEVIPIPLALQTEWKDQRTPRHRRIVETLKHGFQLGPLTNTLPRELKWLFDVRRNAVHFREMERDVVPHPTGVNVAPEQLVFSAPASHRATRLVASVLRVLVDRPKPVGSVMAWVDNHRQQLMGLVDGELGRAAQASS